MKQPIKNSLILLAAAALVPLAAHAQGTAFTYQGRLHDGGNPASGNYDLRFSLHDDPTGGNNMGFPITNRAVLVSSGLFTTTLDFGQGPFNGRALWLQLALRTNGSGVFNPLAPRQPLTPTPYTIFANTASNLSGLLPVSQLTGTPAAAVNFTGNLAGEVTGTQNATVVARVGGQTAADLANGAAAANAATSANAVNTIVKRDASGNFSAGTVTAGAFSGDGANLTALNASRITSGTVPDARLAANLARTNQVWLLGGNAGTTPGTHFLGTTDNKPVEIRVNGTRALRLEPTANGTPNIIAGSAVNSVSAGVFGVTISGGGNNLADTGTEFATIGGGQVNAIRAGGYESTIGGGYRNTIETFDSTIGGGAANTIQTNSQYSTIAGGTANRILAGAVLATIGGGSGNLIQSNAPYAAIPGGVLNTAGGQSSFAAGYRAKAMHQGSFVWADSQDTDFISTASNQFLLRAAGGVGLNKNNPATAFDVNGTVTATSFAGNGAGLTGLNAASLTGSVPGAALTSVPAGNLTGTIPDARLSASVSLLGASIESAEITDGTIAPGDLNLAAFNPTFWRTTGNAGITPGTQFLGTTDNQPVEIRVNGTRALRLEPTVGGPNLVAGFNGNWVLPGTTSATIAGGGQNGSINRVTALGGTVGGGLNNAVSNWNGTVSGGANNTASGNASSVSGGSENLASGDHAVIGGGQNNTASHYYATVGGGQGNAAALDSSTVGGGWANAAGGKASTVAGGQNNAARASFATVGGGQGNAASNSYATVGGGLNNTASGQYATVGGGADNIASGQYVTIGGGAANIVTNDFAAVAGGFGNTANGSKSFVGGGHNNSARAEYAAVGGGAYNVASGARATVGGGEFNGAIALRATVGGGYDNTASGMDATVGGGVYNNATDLDATVAGGSGNTASGIRATVGGGYNNLASGYGAFIGGGYNNLASGYGAFIGGGGVDGNGGFVSPGPNVASGPASVIGGGMFNTASGWWSTVGGGWSNTASGSFATVGGGDSCTASGAWSFAAGYRAQATHNGSFVWADRSSGDNFYSSRQDEFSVRCSGGARFFSSWTLASGVLLNPGDGSWSSASDRNLKENFREVDTRQVLERVARLPVTEWNYKTQGPTVRHIGPMAQDFHAAFALGTDDKHIATVDADGVALAAIQGLNQKVEEQSVSLRAKDAELQALKASVVELQQAVRRLTQTSK
jgi:hypothetical protein